MALLALDLALLGVRYNPTLPARYGLAPPPALSFLLERAAEAPAPFRVLAPGWELLPNMAAYYGLWDLRSSDPMRPEFPTVFLTRTLPARYQPWEPELKRVRDDRRELFRFFGVRYQLTRHLERLPAPWRVAFEGVGGKVWVNAEAGPLFYVPEEVRPAPDRDGRRYLERVFEPRALLPERVRRLPDASPPAG